MFSAGTYLISSTVEVSIQNINLKGKGATIKVSDPSNLTTYKGWPGVVFKRLFHIKGGAKSSSRDYNLTLSDLQFECTADDFAMVVHAEGAFDRIRVERNRARGFTHCGTFGKQFYTANSGDPEYYSDAAITRFAAEGNDIEYSGGRNAKQNGTAFHVLHALGEIIGPIDQYVTDFEKDQALQFLDEHGDHPFLLILTTTAPHAPSLPAEGDQELFEGYLYRGVLRRPYKCHLVWIAY
jgi:hypothetical protein